MRITVCLLVAVLIGYCSAKSEKRFLKELEHLEEIMKSKDNEKGIAMDLPGIPSRLRARIYDYVPSNRKSRKRFLKCAGKVWGASVPTQLVSVNEPSKEVIDTSYHLPYSYQKDLIQYANGMRQVVDIFIHCGKPKVSKKKGNKKYDITEFYNQFKATAKLLSIIRYLPKGFAWKLLMYYTSIPADGRIEAANCEELAYSKAEDRFNEEFPNLKNNMPNLSYSERSVVFGYISGVYYIVNNLLDCTTPGP